MRTRALILLAVLSACGGGDDEVDADLVVLDDASDEVFVILEDLVERGEVEIDDALAARVVAPADGDELSAAERPTLTWEHALGTARHGRITGDFVWLRIDCPNLDEPVDVVAIETEEWTVDEAHWDEITAAALQSDSAQCGVAVTSAYVDDAIVEEGPYQPSSQVSYFITE